VISISGFDYRAAAAALFNVHPENVTPTMIGRVRVMTFATRHQQPLVELRQHHPDDNSTDPLTASLEYWPDCPVCKQSATGRYWNGIHGCTRCGWSAGGNKSKRGSIHD
jgi:hypothetical protein